MFNYELTETDRLPVPASYLIEDRYLGYRRADEKKPWAKYFATATLPVQPHVPGALLAGMSPAEYGYGIAEAAQVLSQPGYQKMETGWTKLDTEVVVVHCLTDMPGVTGQMWDWWFGWHSADSSRYKLWYPDAHQFSGVGEARSFDRALSDKQRYINNVSYVDEYVGGVLTPLTIRFFDPSRLGFSDPSDGGTVITARVGLSILPTEIGWIVHQVRPTERGAEMRSRFYLNDLQHLDLNPESIAIGPSGLPQLAAIDFQKLAIGLLFHCASEMNHLASFLPALFAEFEGTP
jgi:hypothetical protein